MAFKEIEAPFGAFIGWGERSGQHVTGWVTDYDEFGGNDFAKNPCPLVEFELTEQAQSFNKKGDRTIFKVGDTVQVTCGQKSLKRAVKHAELKRGMLAKIVLDDLMDVNEGTAKIFKVYVDPEAKREPSSGSDDSSSADLADNSDDSDIPF